MTIDVNGITLHFTSAGSGEPLLWLHGFGGCGADWRFLFDEPPAGYQLIAPDLRGHGASSTPAGAFTFKDSALDIRALLAHLGIARVKAIGLSGGGITLLHMATADPPIIDSMVLVSAAPYFPAEARAFQRQFSEAMLGDAELQRMRARHVRGEAQLQWVFAQARAFADSYDDVNFTAPLLGTIAARTLVVHGDRDPLYPVRIGVDLHLAIPRSSLWIVPGGGHGPIFGPQRGQFVETALAHLKG